LFKNTTFDNEKFPVGIVLSSLILIVPLTVILGAIGSSVPKLIFLVSIPSLIFIFFNFRLSFLLLIIIMFVNIRLIGFSVSVLFTIFLFFSFLINFKNIHIKDFKSPIVLFFLIFLLSSLPSIIATDVLSDVLYKMINLLAFLILLLICVSGFKDQSEIKKFYYVFVTLSLLNSVYIIFVAISTKSRAFGLTGVMFVDFVGIAIIVITIWLLLAEAGKKIIYLPILLTLILGSLFTQTRNSWVSIFILILLIFSFFYSHSGKYGLNRRKLVTVLLFIVISIGGIYASLKIINPNVSERAEQFTESEGEIVNQSGVASNSLVSRLFIWDTALNAFRDKPVIGVGIYGFPYVSQKYYTIPKLLYDKYVYGRTPHIGYLAIATETGIIGLIGYMIFIISILKFSYESIKLSRTDQENLISISLFFSLLYIVISMLMTDAWLWDQGIVLWGIILGLSMVNRKILLGKIIHKNKLH